MWQRLYILLWICFICPCVKLLHQPPQTLDTQKHCVKTTMHLPKQSNQSKTAKSIQIEGSSAGHHKLRPLEYWDTGYLVVEILWVCVHKTVYRMCIFIGCLTVGGRPGCFPEFPRPKNGSWTHLVAVLASCTGMVTPSLGIAGLKGQRNGCWLTTERRVEMDWTVVLTQKQPDSCSECKWLSCICEKAQEASNMFAVPLKEFPSCTCLSIGLFHYIRLGSQYHPRCFCAFRIWTQTLARCPTAKKWTECCIHLYTIYIYL